MILLCLFAALLVTCANGSPSALEVDSYVEAFSGLLGKNVTLESLTHLADNCDYYANMSAIGGRVIAESLHNDSTKSDPFLRHLRHKIIPLRDRRARRSGGRKKRNVVSGIEELQKTMEQRFSDLTDHRSATANEIASSYAWINFDNQVTWKLSSYEYELTDITTPDDFVFMGERGLRQLCDSIDYTPRRVRIYIEVFLTKCLLGCELYRFIAQKKFTVFGVNGFASVLHSSFVKILMYDTICDELVYESASNKATFRRRNAAQLQELIGKIVETVGTIKEGYWPHHALRLAKDAIGSSNVAVPEAEEVRPTYRRVGERILANLTSKYPWYSYGVIVSYPHESSKGYAVLDTNSSVVVSTASPHRNIHVNIFRRTPSSRPRISLTEFDRMKDRISETFKSAGTILADGLRTLNSSMPELFADGGFTNAYAMRCHRSSDPAAWSTSPFTVTIGHYSELEVDSYVETFAGLLSKNVTVDSLTHLADNCDFYANLSAIGGRAIAESLHNDSTKKDSYLRQLRHKINPLWNRRAGRSGGRTKRGAVSDIEALQNSMEQRFSDLMERQSATTSEIMSTYAWNNFDNQVTWKLSLYDHDLTYVTTPDSLLVMGEERLRRLCNSIDYEPTRVRIYLETFLTQCLFGCTLYRVIGQEKYTVFGVNNFASTLHKTFVKILMYDTICNELVYETEDNKATFRRWNAAQMQELIEKIVKTIDAVKEEYWPHHALRLSKDAFGSSDIAVPEADEVNPTYRSVAERVLANLITKYPWYSYDVAVSYPHESSEAQAVLDADSSIVVGTTSPHRNVQVTIFRRRQSQGPRISLNEFDGMKKRITETFKSAGTILADGLRTLNSSMPELFAVGGFANAYATRCHRSSDPAAWTTSPFTVTIGHYSGIFPFRRCAFIAFLP